MYFCLDIGNTRIKAAVFNQQQMLIQQRVFNELTIPLLDKLLEEHDITAIIVSSVKKRASIQDLLDYLNDAVDFFMVLTHQTPIPIYNAYASPQTLGNDRLAVVVAAHQKYPAQNTLIIDAGTCITYDFLDQKGEYHGGAIAPGIHMKCKALHNFTDQLPLVEPKHLGNLIGQTTRQSMLSGVLWGTVSEMEGLMQRYRGLFPNLKVLLTGGDRHFFESLFKKQIFVHPHLVLEGLVAILHYNIEHRS